MKDFIGYAVVDAKKNLVISGYDNFPLIFKRKKDIGKPGDGNCWLEDGDTVVKVRITEA